MPFFPVEETEPVLYPAFLALSSVGILAGAAGLFWPSARRLPGAVSAGRLLLVTLMTVPVLSFLQWAQGPASPLAGWGSAVVALTAGGMGFHQALSSRFLRGGSRALPLSLCLLSFGLAGWTAWQADPRAGLVFEAPSAEQVDAEFKKAWFPDGVIQTAPPDESYVCHDWSFSRGSVNVPCRDFDLLLYQYNYQPVEEPAVGDIIVYRNPTGAVMHSGVVRALGDNRLVIIESKWGSHSRFLHGVEVQGFPSPSTYSYYRQFNPDL